MKRIPLLLALLFTSMSATAQLVGHWESRSPMPAKRSNMAATSLQIGDTTWIFTFMGIDSAKACGTSIRKEAWKYNTVSDQWSPIADVPSQFGRIAASATGFDGKVYLIGGYRVANNCSEYTSPRVDIYDPATDTWSLGDSIPTPTDDHVQFLWRDSLIYCISGWSQSTNIKRVQVYDPANDAWQYASDIVGPGLFGHAGGVSGDTILYLDGVRISGFSFVLTNEVWMGVLDANDPTQIQWSSLGVHPGAKVYRGGGASYGGRMLFFGGTNNAYNIDGIGYNGSPSVESGRTFGYDLASGTWEEYAHNPDSVMDVREVVQVGNKFYVIGGMEANQTVADKVSVFVVDSVTVSRPEPQGWAGWSVKADIDGSAVWLETETGGWCRLSVVDLNGREVALLYEGLLNRGRQIQELPEIPKGIYLIRLETNKRQLSLPIRL